jgi:ATP phosphoribosyltransferase
MTDRLPSDTVRLGLPSGSLQQSTLELFGRAGFKINVAERSSFPRIDDDKLSAVFFRAQEISRYVVDNIIDCGLTGYDYIVENGNEKDVVEVCELTYSRATANPYRWVLAVPEESPVRKPEDLAGKIVATELVNTTRRYFEGKNIKVNVEFSWGTTEVKARLLDAIVEGTETGSSLRANNLRVVDTLLTSTTRFVANKAAWEIPWKREKMENIAMLLRGAIEGEGGAEDERSGESARGGGGIFAFGEESDGEPVGGRGMGCGGGDFGGSAGAGVDSAAEASRGDRHYHLSAEQGDSVKASVFGLSFWLGHENGIAHLIGRDSGGGGMRQSVDGTGGAGGGDAAFGGGCGESQGISDFGSNSTRAGSFGAADEQAGGSYAAQGAGAFCQWAGIVVEPSSISGGGCISGSAEAGSI